MVVLSITLIKTDREIDNYSVEVCVKDHSQALKIGEESELSLDLTPSTIVFKVYTEGSLKADQELGLDRILGENPRTVWIKCKGVSSETDNIKVKITVSKKLPSSSDLWKS